MCMVWVDFWHVYGLVVECHLLVGSYVNQQWQPCMHPGHIKTMHTMQSIHTLYSELYRAIYSSICSYAAIYTDIYS